MSTNSLKKSSDNSPRPHTKNRRRNMRCISLTSVGFMFQDNKVTYVIQWVTRKEVEDKDKKKKEKNEENKKVIKGGRSIPDCTTPHAK